MLRSANGAPGPGEGRGGGMRGPEPGGGAALSPGGGWGMGPGQERHSAEGRWRLGPRWGEVEPVQGKVSWGRSQSCFPRARDGHPVLSSASATAAVNKRPWTPSS